MKDLNSWLQACPLIAILRGVKPEEVVDIGAALIETVDDILNQLGTPQPADKTATPVVQKTASVGDDDLSRAHAEIERLLSPTPVLVDELVRVSGLPSATVQMVLTEKELAGRMQRHPGGKVSAA